MLNWIKNLLSKNSVQLVAGVMTLILIGVFAVQIYHLGYSAGADAVQTKWNEQRAAQAEKQTQATQQTATAQHLLDEQAARLHHEYMEQLNNVKTDYEQRMAAVRSSSERVYIATNTPCSPANGSHAATAGTTAQYPENAAELNAQTVADLASIARDGDSAIILLNEMIDRYNAARAAIQQLEQQLAQQQGHKKP